MDIENATEASGFPLLARRIALNPDYESFIFRKFDRLSARNLLHLEGKLAYLEHKLDQADKHAFSPTADTESHRSIRAWEAFEENAEDIRRPEYARMKIAEQIQETLAIYQEALIRQNQIATLERPKKRALDVARHLSHTEVSDASGNTRKRSLLSGLSEQRLDDRHHHDLVAVRKPAEKDLVSRYLQDHWMFKTTSTGDDFEYIKEKHVNWVAAGVSTVAAALLLLGAIVMLHFLHDETAQLGVIAMLAVLFAISVGVLTNARRAETFAATAAYAAVLVVFVSSDTGPSSCTCTVQA